MAHFEPKILKKIWGGAQYLAQTSPNAAISQSETANKLPRKKLAHYFGLFRGFELLLGYLTTSGAKSGVTFLLGDPHFL